MGAGTIFRFVRWRTKHGSGPGSWVWDEFAFSAKCRTLVLLNAEFRAHHAETLNDRWNTGGDGWRGIEWEFAVPPKEVLEKAHNNTMERLSLYKQKSRRVLALLQNAKPQKPNLKKPCRNFPSCGCMVESRTKDCRLPYDFQRKQIDERAARTR